MCIPFRVEVRICHLPYSYICISSVIRNKDFQSPYPSNPQLPDSEVTYFQRSIQSLTAAVSCPSQQDLPSTSIENNRYICSRALQKKRKGQESQAGLWLMSSPLSLAELRLTHKLQPQSHCVPHGAASLYFPGSIRSSIRCPCYTYCDESVPFSKFLEIMNWSTVVLAVPMWKLHKHASVTESAEFRCTAHKYTSAPWSRHGESSFE